MSTLAIKGNGFQSKLLWAAVIALGVVSFAIVALSRGEPVNAAWLVIAAEVQLLRRLPLLCAVRR
jgi:carbon starvation protein